MAAGLELFDLESHAPASGQASGDRPLVTAETASDPAPIWELDAAGASPGAAARESAREAPEVENLAVLDPELPQSPRAASPAPAPPAVRPDGPGGRSGPVRLIAVAVLSAFLGAGAVVAFYLLYVQPSIDALETRIDELTGDPGGPWQPPAREPAPLVSEGGTQAAGGPPPASRPGQTPDVVDALRGWADAWTEQRADDYLAFYSADFVPPDGLGRAAWEESRRARIARPQWIRVALTLVQVEPAGPEEAEVRFVQSYRSERYKDLVRKRMRMVLEDGAWKVAAERVVSR